MNISIPKRFPSKMCDRTLYCLDSVIDPQIGIVITSDDRFEEKLLEKAIRLSLDSEPHLGCRFVPTWWTAHWERVKDLDQVNFFCTRYESDPYKDMISFLAEPINFVSGPQVKSMLLRGKSDVLCIKMSHLVTDAGGVKKYAYLLSSIYRALISNHEFVPSPNLTGSRSMRQISSFFNFARHLGIIRRGFLDQISLLHRKSPYTLKSESAKPSGRTYITLRISPETLSKIWAKTHSLSATINDYMIALLLRGLYQLNGEEDSSNLRLIVTADLRRYLPQGWKNALCNLSGWVFPNVVPKPGNNVQDTCRSVRNIMNQQKSDYLGLGSFPFLTLINRIIPLNWMKRIFEKVSKKALERDVIAPSFTNMGLIEDEKLDFGQIVIKDAFLLPPIVKPPYWACGLSGFRNSLTFSSGFCESGTDPILVHRLFDYIFEELQLV